MRQASRPVRRQPQSAETAYDADRLRQAADDAVLAIAKRRAIAVEFQPNDGGPGEYDCVELVFPRPLLYGEGAVVHHAMEMDDSDGASLPRVEFRVNEPVQLIAWRIELRNLPRSCRREARLTRRRIDAKFQATPEHVARVPFDAMVRGYEHQITCPEPGYFYCLEWDR